MGASRPKPSTRRTVTCIFSRNQGFQYFGRGNLTGSGLRAVALSRGLIGWPPPAQAPLIRLWGSGFRV